MSVETESLQGQGAGYSPEAPVFETSRLLQPVANFNRNNIQESCNNNYDAGRQRSVAASVVVVYNNDVGPNLLFTCSCCCYRCHYHPHHHHHHHHHQQQQHHHYHYHHHHQHVCLDQVLLMLLLLLHALFNEHRLINCFPICGTLKASFHWTVGRVI